MLGSLRRVSVRVDRPQLPKHRQVIADGPPLGDLAVSEPVHGGEVACVVAGGGRDAEELPAMPVAGPPAELHDELTLGYHHHRLPVLAGHLVSSLGLEELPGAGETLPTIRGEGVIDHVWGTQLVQCAEVGLTQQRIETLDDSLVVFGTHESQCRSQRSAEGEDSTSTARGRGNPSPSDHGPSKGARYRTRDRC